MRRHLPTSRAAFACAALLFCVGLATPAHGQIAVVADEHGRKIYVNDADPPSVTPKSTHTSRAYTGELAKPSPEISTLVDTTASRMQVDPKLVQAVIQVESGYNPRAVSRKGAQGLMQLMPSTAERFGVQNTFNPKQNIEGGVSYLKYLLELFGGNIPLSVAAYNAGEHAVQRHGGIPQFTETVNYVQRVTTLYGSQTAIVQNGGAAIYKTVDANGVVHFTNDGL